MSLIICHECGKEISDSSPICPNCGYSVSKTLKYEVVHKYDKEINGMLVNLMGVYIKCGYDQRKTAMYISEKTDISIEKAEKIVLNFYIDYGNDKHYVNDYKKAVCTIDPNNRSMTQNKSLSVSKVVFIAFAVMLFAFIISPNIRDGFVNCGSNIRIEIGTILKMESAIREKYDNAYVETPYLGLVFIPMEEINNEYEFTGNYHNNYPVFKSKEENSDKNTNNNVQGRPNNTNTKEPWQ